MKQIDGVGSHGEPLIEFSVYDALEAGFRKAVFVIQKEHEAAFRSALTDRMEKKMEIAFAYQDMTKNLHGTVPALLACKDVLQEPFMVIDANTWYGKKTFKDMYQFLQEETEQYAVICDPASPVHCYGFTPAVFATLEAMMEKQKEKTISCEYDLVQADSCLTDVKRIARSEEWFSINEPQDKRSVIQLVSKMKNNGTYLDILWK